jgi:hypothetical protein
MEWMRRLLTLSLMAGSLYGQEFQPKRITVGIGVATPGDASNSDPGVALSINFAHRYTRNIQADLGLQTSFNQDYRNQVPSTGAGLTTTTNFFVPLGGRIIIPLLEGRLEPSFGLGGVYAYDKRRSGDKHQAGAYGLAGISYAIDSSQRHWLGVTVRYINMMSAGRPHPTWVNVTGEYTYSWGW